MAWVVIANLKGLPGDAAAMGKFAEIENRFDGVDFSFNAIDQYLLKGSPTTLYAIPFADKNGSVAGGVRTDGAFNFEKPPMIQGQVGVTFQPVNAPGFSFLYVDRDGYVSQAITAQGETVVYKGSGSSGGGVTSLQAGNDALGYTKTRSDRITTIGDSLTYGYFGGTPGPTADAWPSKLQTLLGAPVTLTNLGISGYTVDEEAIRVGAFPVPLTVAGGSIPASGSVDVTTSAVIGWVPAGTRSYVGSLAGIPGTLTRTSASNTVFSFTRTSAGTATTVPAGTLFVSDFAGHADEILFILLGRNDVSNGVMGAHGSVVEHVVAGIKRIVGWHARDLKKVVVMSVTNTQSETSGTGGHATVLEINSQLATIYGPRFIDIRSLLVNDAIYALGITPTTEDLAAMAADAIPSSIMDDNTHWSKDAHTFVAEIAHNYLTDRDWTAS
ncbi:hypothetical protein [Glutamicibacter arilaitensis]|uniref:hypothetical protein n=1 Tax=Glutamicibacter arilaitensis TaxID=256701 RepID=UPI003F92D6D5